MEEELIMATTDEGDAVSTEGETNVDMSNNSPVKRGRGRPQGSKKLKVSVIDLNMTELVLSDSNGESTQPRRGRGRPRLSDTKQRGSGVRHASSSVQSPRGRGRLKGSKNQTSNEGQSTTEHSKKRGRPKKSVTIEKAAAEDILNGSVHPPKRGRPKGSMKCKSEGLTSGEEEEGSTSTPRKRGRPRGSPNKKPRLERRASSSEGSAEANRSQNYQKRARGRPRKAEVNSIRVATQDTSNGISKMPQRGRGRPRKSIEQKTGEKQQLVTDGSQPVRRGRGRPKGSLNKVRAKVGRPQKLADVPARGRKRGRPRQQPAKRGRPRKYPLPSPDELKKPKVWKPLGRPRKYPRVEPPEGDHPAPRRSRGRPRKSESKKGAHLRKSLPTTPSTAHNLSDGHQRKRRRTSGNARSEDITPRKRGRPKGSPNKNKARGKTQLDSTFPNHSKAEGDSPGVWMESEVELERKEEMTPIKDVDHTEETVIVQDVSFDISDQA